MQNFVKRYYYLQGGSFIWSVQIILGINEGKDLIQENAMDGVLIQERVNTIVNGDQAQETDEDVQDHEWV